MFRSTTPTLHFELCDRHITIDDFSKMILTISQKRNILIEKNKEDLDIHDERHFSITLTQEESKLFEPQFLVEIQLKCLDYNDNVVASEIFSMKVRNALNEEIIDD